MVRYCSKNYDIVKIQIVEKNLRLILSFYDNIYFVGMPPKMFYEVLPFLIKELRLKS